VSKIEIRYLPSPAFPRGDWEVLIRHADGSCGLVVRCESEDQANACSVRLLAAHAR
jgi:hypothetical protein